MDALKENKKRMKEDAKSHWEAEVKRSRDLEALRPLEV